MTVEESKNLWKIERANMQRFETNLSPSIKKLYKLVGDKIESGELLYSTFSSDTLDLLTKAVAETEEGADRSIVVDRLTDLLIKKYESGNFEPLNEEENDSNSTESVR